MFKKLLGIMLAVILAVSPVATFAEGESAVTFPIAENFNDGEIPTAWSSGEFCSDDYGYLRFTANEAGATLSRELGIEEGSAFTVDFRVMVESGSATASVGAYSFDLGADFVPGLWYDVRVASEGNSAAATLYVDAAVVATDLVAETFEEFKITAASEAIIGIDDFTVYNKNMGTDELKSTPLDFKFDDFIFTNNATTANSNPAPTISAETTKFDELTAGWSSGTQGAAPVFGTNFSSMANIDIKKGVFGKAKTDSSAYLNHKESGYSSYSDSTLDFSIGEGGYLPNAGDKQVISFNFAFASDVPEDLIIRTFNIYEDSAGNPIYGGKSGASATVTGADGQVMRIVGESMYLFGTKFYSIRPALLPNQWNNIRLELEVGDGAYNSTTTNNSAMKISAYVNDMVVAKDIKITSNAYFVRDPQNNAALRGCFNGVHHLQFNYNWADERKTENGIYLDDVKITNYYAGAKYEAVDSPIIWNEKGSLSLDKFAEPSEGWTAFRNDKWVQGNVVYVDCNRTLKDYKEDLTEGKNLGIIFRDAAGNEITELDRAIGDLTYAEITRTDYSKIYVSLIGKQTELTEFTLDGDETFDTSWDANGVKNNTVGAWDSDGDSSDWGADGGDDNAVTSQNALLGKADSDKVLKIAAASDGSEKKTKFSFFRKNGDVPTSGTPTVYTKADYFRPITFEGSVLIPSEGSSLNIKTVNMWGSRKSYVYGKGSTQTNHNDASYSLIHFKDGYITARTPYGTEGYLELGKYNVGEWNRIAFTVYPGYGRYRIDASVNGKNAEEYIYISTGGNIAHQAIVWLMLNTVGDVYIDDFKATTGYYDHRDGSRSITLPKLNTDALSADGENVVLKKNSVAVSSLKTELAELGTIRVYTDNTYASVNEGNLDANSVIVAENDENVIEYFTVSNREIAVTEADGTYTATTFASDENAVLIAAQYNAKGLVMVNKSSDKPDANGKLSVSFSKDTATTEIKVFLLGNLSTITPEMAFKPVSVAAAE